MRLLLPSGAEALSLFRWIMYGLKRVPLNEILSHESVAEVSGEIG
jgi:hypothetical protein